MPAKEMKSITLKAAVIEEFRDAILKKCLHEEFETLYISIRGLYHQKRFYPTQELVKKTVARVLEMELSHFLDLCNAPKHDTFNIEPTNQRDEEEDEEEDDEEVELEERKEEENGSEVWGGRDVSEVER
jgi:hypothetical protein